ncbi:MAG: phosphatidylserine decarboxylase [Alphaproteobacteria bacterium]|nr:phosphatidylserine decarboxylase [Alphaproteobacteria bacterium]
MTALRAFFVRLGDLVNQSIATLRGTNRRTTPQGNDSKNLLKAPRLHPESHAWLFGLGIFSLGCWLVGWWIGWVAAALFVLIFLVARMPLRVPPHRAEGVLLSPADGIVSAIDRATPPDELTLPANVANKEMQRVVIDIPFFESHVNRAPAAGVVSQLRYRPANPDANHAGKDAEGREANQENGKERQSMVLCLPVELTDDPTSDATNGHGDDMVIVSQVAGVLFRRIGVDITEGAELAQGDVYGIIRFGSQAVLYFPPQLTVAVAVGQRTIGGETIIANFAPTHAPS